MTILHTFFQQLLKVPEQDVEARIVSRCQNCFPTLDAHWISALMRGDRSVQDDLWKASVCLGVPHQLLFDAFVLQQKISQTTGR